MSTITIQLPDDRMQLLQKLADEKKMSPELILVALVQELLMEPKPDFKTAAQYVLKKNEELYRRLA